MNNQKSNSMEQNKENLTCIRHTSLIASVIARETTYCKSGSLRPSSISKVKENITQPGGDSHTFFDRPSVQKHQSSYNLSQNQLPLKNSIKISIKTSAFELQISNTNRPQWNLTEIPV